MDPRIPGGEADGETDPLVLVYRNITLVLNVSIQVVTSVIIGKL